LVRAAPPIVEGAVELVRALHAAGVALAVGSSGPRANVELIVAAMGAAPYIAVIVSGDDVSRGKPDPQVFELSARHLGMRPDRCVVIEDAPVGIAAARAAGCRTVAVLMHHPREAFDGADLIVSCLADLTVQCLASLAGGD
jgi:HAD superfamily hydrolase (TIGR01509 family)